MVNLHILAICTSYGAALGAMISSNVRSWPLLWMYAGPPVGRPCHNWERRPAAGGEWTRPGALGRVRGLERREWGQTGDGQQRGGGAERQADDAGVASGD